MLQLSRTLKGLKAKARPGKVAFISSVVSDPLLSMNQEGPHSNSRCCTAGLLSPIQSDFELLFSLNSLNFFPFQDLAFH